MAKHLDGFLVSQRSESKNIGVSRNDLRTKRKLSMETPIGTRMMENPSLMLQLPHLIFLGVLPPVIFSEQWILGVHVIPFKTKLEVLGSYWVFVTLYIAGERNETKIIV